MGEGARKQKLLVTLLRLVLGETEPRPNHRERKTLRTECVDV